MPFDGNGAPRRLIARVVTLGSTALLRGVLLASGLCALAGCGDDGEEAAAGNVVLLDQHNYSSTTALSIPPAIETAVGDIEICWTGMTSDLQCHEIDPVGGIDNVALLRFDGMSESDLEGELATGRLSMQDVDAYFEYETDHADTCVQLSAMEIFGSQIDVASDYVDDERFTYLLLTAVGTTPGVGTRSMTFVKPTAASTSTSVSIPSSCGVLDFTADLASAEAVAIPAAGPWVVDWDGLTKNGQGGDLAFESIDSVLLGFYGGMTVEEIQSQIMDLELVATTLWEIPVSGALSADLADARERTASGSPGAAFPGFDQAGDGVWLLGLMCSGCQSPAPLVLTVLEPDGA